MNLVVNPLAAASGLSQALSTPHTTLESLLGQICGSFNDSVINGTSEEAAEWFGYATVEAIGLLITGDEIAKSLKAPSAAAAAGLSDNLIDDAADTAKAIDKIDDVSDLLNKGKTVDELLETGASYKSLYNAGFDFEDLILTDEIIKDLPDIVVEELKHFDPTIEAHKEILDKLVALVDDSAGSGKTAQEILEMTYDSGKKSINLGSVDEVQTAVNLKKNGVIEDFSRGVDMPATSDFKIKIDGKEYLSDVKSFRSSDFDVAKSIEKIELEVVKKGNDFVILEKSQLSDAHIQELKDAIEQAGLTDKIIWSD